jgi:hypothetical protein
VSRAEARLERVLEKIRSDAVPDLRAELVASVADIAVRNQFDDNRAAARLELRKLLELEFELGQSYAERAAGDAG